MTIKYQYNWLWFRQMVKVILQFFENKVLEGIKKIMFCHIHINRLAMHVYFDMFSQMF